MLDLVNGLEMTKQPKMLDVIEYRGTNMDLKAERDALLRGENWAVSCPLLRWRIHRIPPRFSALLLPQLSSKKPVVISKHSKLSEQSYSDRFAARATFSNRPLQLKVNRSSVQLCYRKLLGTTTQQNRAGSLLSRSCWFDGLVPQCRGVWPRCWCWPSGDNVMLLWIQKLARILLPSQNIVTQILQNPIHAVYCFTFTNKLL